MTERIELTRGKQLLDSWVRAYEISSHPVKKVVEEIVGTLVKMGCIHTEDTLVAAVRSMLEKNTDLQLTIDQDGQMKEILIRTQTSGFIQDKYQ